MAWNYKCDSCGCYLDPCEGLLCEECRDRIREKTKKRKKLDALLDTEDPQVSMKLEEMTACV